MVHPSDPGGVNVTVLGDFTDRPPDACTNYEQCGNRIPTAELMCAECLDRVRHKGTNGEATGTI